MAADTPSRFTYLHSPGVNGQSFQSLASGGGAGVGRGGGATIGAGDTSLAGGDAAHPARVMKDRAIGTR